MNFYLKNIILISIIFINDFSKCSFYAYMFVKKNKMAGGKHFPPRQNCWSHWWGLWGISFLTAKGLLISLSPSGVCVPIHAVFPWMWGWDETGQQTCVYVHNCLTCRFKETRLFRRVIMDWRNCTLFKTELDVGLSSLCDCKCIVARFHPLLLLDWMVLRCTCWVLCRS